MARPKIGQRYLTVSGVPVQVTGMDERGLLLQSLASDNRFPVPAGYPLRLYRGEESVYQTRANPYGHSLEVPSSMGKRKPTHRSWLFVA
ncbi:MAG: hypothetical protein A3J70_12795 [Elusimicrobia bacterium RIFCSPHIGHO2_02_FULL_61_10]|nr:MAG: hypothetical protein A3J70_12795 [Elusimicrobia bacterium RIFCSPHIGHO2_02_FULL_61_10]